ncbi:Metallo-dependent phosphatase-like protein [Gymnopilus junonius]|uniref:Metallo-dependent phosphatase-like protein n=1 Tax=Gymnopilus junonius TaxID=109634 RepID=A0A9P5NW71_GYMJU|nr:Metallo-dependent phosphatase-like protein [Gymnopilus junonius]
MSFDSIFRRRSPSAWERFCKSPLVFFAELGYISVPKSGISNLAERPIRIVCISDTHKHTHDLTQHGTAEEMDPALTWLDRQEHPHKVFIAGNHDRCLDDPDFTNDLKQNLKCYGSPFTPRQGPWSFQYPRTSPTSTLNEDHVWASIPDDIDVLIAHGPPRCHLDLGPGCVALLVALWRVRPKLHVFGHIHGGRGTETVQWTKDQKAYERILCGVGSWPPSAFLWIPVQDLPVLGQLEHGMLHDAGYVARLRDEKHCGAVAADI